MATVAVRTPTKDTGRRVDATKYAAMQRVLLRVMPTKAPGITEARMGVAVAKLAPKTIFPNTTHSWWAKCVQLDLEARGKLVREKTTPVRWHLA
jgi:hypothetical protein